jgi:large subunit ribosomal protein L40e
MKIFVKSVLDGRLVGLEVENTTSVKEIKSQMAELEGVNVEDQRILFTSRELSDECTMETLDVVDGSNLEMNFRLLGGAVASDIPDHLKELANKYKVNKMICRKCYARLPLGSHTCRKRKCGHSANLRPKKKIKDKEGKK